MKKILPWLIFGGLGLWWAAKNSTALKAQSAGLAEAANRLLPQEEGTLPTLADPATAAAFFTFPANYNAPTGPIASYL